MAIFPLVILAVGVCTVIGLIIFLRLNAFLALIIAAMVVSLMAPGDSWGGRISRVADAFGSAAAGIAIVIALAAIIGTCMMDSGAADRIVRAFLKVLGEKQSSMALMGSGFVLAVPVFFDTVFYLLVPLARSLYRRTARNYLKYLLAIAAGGAITHTMVPPTPGPLLMASNLNVDLGMMILVGTLVAMPAALVGIVVAGFMDKVMKIPMRPLAGREEPQPLDDSQLPSLSMSLLPVVLPVLLISANTVISTLADAQQTAVLSSDDVTDWPAFANTIRLADEDESPSPARRVAELLPDDLMESLPDADDGSVNSELRQRITDALNEVLVRRDFLDPGASDFDSVLLPNPRIDRILQEAEGNLSQNEVHRLQGVKAVNGLLGRDLSRLSKVEVTRLNRLLLESAFPDLIRRHEWNTPLRKASDIAGLFGNPNFALLVSTIVALGIYYRQLRPTKLQMAEMVETSLMSGGVIILITAGGGAFGAMLKTANIGAAIQEMFADGGGTGTVMLLLGFGIASVLKVAQGSGTVSMITASSMIAAMLTEPGAVDSLGYHPVYLATAVGAGSLVGSWMNDSGFWIFAKMGGLTEVEALKSWTILLIILGCASICITLLLANILPLV